MWLVTPLDQSVTQQRAQVKRALRNFVHYKARDKRWNGRAAKHIDTFLLGWKGIEYVGDGEKDCSERGGSGGGGGGNGNARKFGCGSEKLASRMAAEKERKANGENMSAEEKRDLVELWQVSGSTPRVSLRPYSSGTNFFLSVCPTVTPTTRPASQPTRRLVPTSPRTQDDFRIV